MRETFVYMPFGKHEGKDLAALPVNYLEWLLGEDWFDGWLRDEVEEEFEIRSEEIRRAEQKRKAELYSENEDDLPQCMPLAVAEVILDRWESGQIVVAAGKGVLTLFPHEPVSSKLEQAWRAWRGLHGMPAPVCVVTLDDWMCGIRG